jgi:DNA-binding LytR/AlgR family response regulator
MYKIAICDDNLFFLNDLSERIKNFSAINKISVIIQCFEDSEILIELVDERKMFDAYILDIEMPYYSGIDLVDKIKEVSEVPYIILITAYSNYAINACGLGIFRYLLKDNIVHEFNNLLKQLFDNLNKQSDDKIYIIDNIRRFIKLYQKDIIYIYKEDKNIVFVLANNRIEKQRLTLQEVYKKLNNDEMFFLDRGYIINIRHIIKIHSNLAEMDNGYNIVSSRINILKLKKYLNFYWGGEYLIFYNIIEVFVTMLECTVGILFVGSIMGKSSENHKSIIALSLLLSSVVVIINQYNLFSIFTTIIGIIGIALCAKLVFDIGILDALIISSLYLILIHIIDFLSISILGTILNNHHFGIDIISNYSRKRLYHVFLTKLLLIYVYFEIVKKYLNKTHVLIRKMWGALIICSILVYYIGKQTFLEVNFNMSMIWLLIFAIILLGSYSLWQFVLYIKVKEKLYCVIEKNEMIIDKNRNLIEKNNKIEKYYHNLKNHNIIIEECIKDKNYSIAERYYRNLHKNEKKCIIHNKWTGIDILDNFIDYKKRYAEERNIIFHITSDLVKINITELDLISLFGNAIDNAIESCEKIRNDNKKINLTIKKINEMLYIQISNTYDEELIKYNNVYMTSKKDKKYHGLGINEIRSIVSNYNGSINIETKNKIFTINISFFE